MISWQRKLCNFLPQYLYKIYYHCNKRNRIVFFLSFLCKRNNVLDYIIRYYLLPKLGYCKQGGKNKQTNVTSNNVTKIYISRPTSWSFISQIEKNYIMRKSILPDVTSVKGNNIFIKFSEIFHNSWRNSRRICPLSCIYWTFWYIYIYIYLEMFVLSFAEIYLGENMAWRIPRIKSIWEML